jgi:hypothetical protein
VAPYSIAICSLARFVARQRRRIVGFEGVVAHAHGQPRERRDGVDAAGAEEHAGGAVHAAVLQQIDRAPEVVLDELPAGGGAVDAGEDARIRRRVDDHVDRGPGLQVRRVADISVLDPDAQPAQRVAIELAARATQVVDAEELMLAVFPPGAYQGRSDESADARDQNLHDTSRPRQASTISLIVCSRLTWTRQLG